MTSHYPGWPPSSSGPQLSSSDQQPVQPRPPRTFQSSLPMQSGAAHPPGNSSVMSHSGQYFGGQATSAPLQPHPNVSTQNSSIQPPLQQPSQHSAVALSAPGHVQSQPQSHFAIPSIVQQTTSSLPHGERDHMDREQRDRRLEQTHKDMNAQRYAQETDISHQQHERQVRDMQSLREQHHSPRENHAGAIPLQQPVASRVPATLHGPNGILNEQHLGITNQPQTIHTATVAGGPGHLYDGPTSSQTGDNLRSFAENLGHIIPAQQHLLNITSAVNAQQTNGSGSTTQHGSQPILNDALSYLDQVKVRFQDQPDVYNRFLDIMKDFKSQAIDTPGVINRVSTLFAGHPELIQGFNTFLPLGYKIECGLNDDPNSIQVTTPRGTVVQQISYGHNRLRPGQQDNVRPAFLSDGPANGDWEMRQHELEQNALAMADSRGNLPAFSEHSLGMGEANAGFEDSHVVDDPAAALGAGLSSSQQLLGLEKRGPVEFNHAIGYVNKIKNRFSSQPEIYKQFLEILQTYQRESKPIQDVYAQVTQLFSSAQDLLEDFKQFLPETAAQAKAQAQAAAKQTEEAAMLSSVRNDMNYAAGNPHNQVQTPRPDIKMPPVGSFAPPSVGKDSKKRRGGAGPQSAGSGTAILDNGLGKNRSLPGLANKRARLDQTKHNVPDLTPVSPTLTPGLPTPLPPLRAQSSVSEGITFFERVKKQLSNRQTFNEFLKLCNVFNQEIIDKDTLVQRTQVFIGSNVELMNWFKRWIRYEGRDNNIENEARIPSGKVVLSSCRGLGPSYRLLPKRERLRMCTGRDELCRQVLNDEWVSHPTWASEESGFIAHRKNTFEEALHRIEEERHDYDINIEACLRTIQLLEPIAQQIKLMSDDEKFTYKLQPGIGGQSETIYQRVIKKIYDRERGCKVIEDMFRRPSAVVPILLGRLKQKSEEWKASQREWEKVWREQTNRIFWKSLDHQGISVKIQDKRQFQPKLLHTEIHTKYEEQRRQRQATPWADIPRYQFSYEFRDLDVIHDCCHLILTDLQFASNGTEVDKLRLDNFIKVFIPTFFDLDREAFLTRMSDIGDNVSINGENEEDQTSEADVSSKSRGNAVPTSTRKQNLLRGVLEKGAKGQSDNGEDGAVVTSTPPQASTEANIAQVAATEQSRTDSTEHRWMSLPSSGNEADLSRPFRRDDFHLYATSNIYCFFRMFHGLYERLLNIKKYESKVYDDITNAKAEKPANELGLIDKLPSNYFSDVSPNANYYRQVVQMCEAVIKGEIEQSRLEESLRRFYMHDGWQLYGFEKMLTAILRFALQILVSDNKDKSLDIINLFYKDRREDETTHSNELTYRKQVEKLGKDGDIFRIRYNRPSRTAAIQVFKKDDKTYEADELAASTWWSYYVSTYSMYDHTEGVPYSSIRLPYLRRNMPFSGGRDSDAHTEELQSLSTPMYNQDGLVIRISPNNYHILYDPHTSDWWIQSFAFRSRGAAGYEEAKADRNRAFGAWFNNAQTNAWMKNLTDSEINQVKVNFNNWIKDDAAANNSANKDATRAGTVLPVQEQPTDATMNITSSALPLKDTIAVAPTSQVEAEAQAQAQAQTQVQADTVMAGT